MLAKALTEALLREPLAGPSAVSSTSSCSAFESHDEALPHYASRGGLQPIPRIRTLRARPRPERPPPALDHEIRSLLPGARTRSSGRSGGAGRDLGEKGDGSGPAPEGASLGARPRQPGALRPAASRPYSCVVRKISDRHRNFPRGASGDEESVSTEADRRPHPSVVGRIRPRRPRIGQVPSAVRGLDVHARSGHLTRLNARRGSTKWKVGIDCSEA